MDERLEEINKQIKEIFDLRDEENRLWFNRMEEFWSDHIVELADRAEQVPGLERDRKYWYETYQEQKELSRGQIKKLQERVQELEDAAKGSAVILNTARAEIQEKDEIIEKLEAENQRYKEAMEKAIGGCIYTNPEVAGILSEALRGES